MTSTNGTNGASAKGDGRSVEEVMKALGDLGVSEDKIAEVVEAALGRTSRRRNSRRTRG